MGTFKKCTSVSDNCEVSIFINDEMSAEKTATVQGSSFLVTSG